MTILAILIVLIFFGVTGWILLLNRVMYNRATLGYTPGTDELIRAHDAGEKINSEWGLDDWISRAKARRKYLELKEKWWFV